MTTKVPMKALAQLAFHPNGHLRFNKFTIISNNTLIYLFIYTTY